MKYKSWIVTLVMILMAVAIGSGVGLAMAKMNRPVVSQNAGADYTPTKEEPGTTLMVDGVLYRRNPNIRSVLFLGIDNGSPISEDDTINNIGRSDVIMLLILDKEKQTFKVLDISRDSMVPLDVYDKNQELLYTYQAQITLQYTVADSRRRGNWLTNKKVSEVLCNTPINNTLSLTMDAIPALVDLLGGITITIPEDYTYIDPAFVEGATLTLNGDQAYRYIRYRDIEEFGSNNGRMERQLQVIRAMAAKLGGGGLSSQMLEKLQNAAGSALESDLDADTIELLRTYQMEDTVYFLPGENVVGAHDEYHLDEAGVRKMVAELFYKPEA